jgi:DNA-binding ferritin-like protein (Dps family)
MSDLFNNPFFENAKKSLTEEQKEEYKKIGEYMYNKDIYSTAETKIKSDITPDEILVYAVQALKSGISPKDLTQNELQSLIDTYGKYWYEKFDLEKEDVPELTITKESLRTVMEEKINNLQLDRKAKKKLKKKLNKQLNKK